MLDIVHDASDDGSVEVETFEHSLELGAYGGPSPADAAAANEAPRPAPGRRRGRACGRAAARSQGRRRSRGAGRSGRSPSPPSESYSPSEQRSSASSPSSPSASSSPVARRVQQVKNAFRTSFSKGGTSSAVGDDDSNGNRHNKDEVRRQGLKFVGFDERRQASVNKKANDCRFKAFYGGESAG